MFSPIKKNFNEHARRVRAAPRELARPTEREVFHELPPRSFFCAKNNSNFRLNENRDKAAFASLRAVQEVASWTSQEDAALMLDLHKVHARLRDEGRLGPAARLGATKGACVLRGRGKGVVIDGPFAESKEQLLGFYVIDCADREAAIAAARDLRQANPGAMYEIRPVSLPAYHSRGPRPVSASRRRSVTGTG